MKGLQRQLIVEVIAFSLDLVLQYFLYVQGGSVLDTLQLASHQCQVRLTSSLFVCRTFCVATMLLFCLGPTPLLRLKVTQQRNFHVFILQID